MTKLTTGLALLAFVGWGAFWAVSKTPPIVKEKIVYQDRVVFKDRIVTKDVVRTETRPDGTKIVTETKVDTEERTSETEKISQVEVHKGHNAKYSLGIKVTPETLFPFKGVYEVEIGKRLWDSPFWGTASFNTKREWTIGIRVEF